MRFLVDAQLPPKLAHWLRSRGHEANHVQDFKLEARPDRWIVVQAQRTNAVIMTKDADFSIAARLSKECRVVWLRIGNSTTKHLLQKLEKALPEIEQSLDDGQTLIEVSE